MRALTWHGTHDVRVDTVPDPEIVNPLDAIIKVTSTAICGSDLHLYDGVIPGVLSGDILGHEFMGEVVETGSGSTLRSEEHTSELQSLMRISYAVFCLKKKNTSFITNKIYICDYLIHYLSYLFLSLIY